MTYASKIEETYDLFQAFIWDNLSGLLTTYQLLDDTIPLPMFAGIKRGDYQINDMHQFPCIIVKPGSIVKNPPGMSRPLTKDLMILKLSFWMVSRGQSPDLLQKVGERYAWAVNEIIDSPSFIPDAHDLKNALRKVTGFDWHMIQQTPNGNISASFVDCELTIYTQRS
jgi:hypothetical protein